MRCTATESALRDFLLEFKTHAPALEQLHDMLQNQEANTQGPSIGAAGIQSYRQEFFETLAMLRMAHHQEQGRSDASAHPERAL